MDSSSDFIQQKMNQSALNWTTIWLDGTYTDLTAGSKAVRQQVWIDQSTARFRFLSGPVDGPATKLKVSDGISILDMDLSTGATQMSTMPQGIAGQFAPQYTPGMASPNPIWEQIGEPLAKLAFSSDYAQSDGTFEPVAIEVVAGRRALVVDWTYSANSLHSWRAWLDVLTGVILKMQTFGKGGGNIAQDEYVVTKVQYDIQNLPDDLYSVSPASVPDFSDVDGSPLESTTPGPTVQAGTDPLGEVYFFIQTPGDDANGARLVRLPGSCVAGLQACPAVEQVTLPGLTFANNGPTLVWSPDYKKAAFIANTSAGSTKLYVSAMPTSSWKQVAEFPSIDLPAWSGDGNWISFRAQDTQGNEDYYVVHPDGSGLKNVTATDKLPAGDRPYNVDGWISNNLIVHSGRPGHAAKVYLLRADDGRVKSLFDSQTAKVSYSPSPDGSLLAFQYDKNSTTQTLRIIAPDGSGQRDLASFKATIYPIVWSPDATSLAFVIDGSAVYVINPDGRGLEQVYGEASISSLTFSPNGKFLLVGTGDQQRLFVVNLINLESHLLSAAGLSLTDWWREPAWVR